MESYTIIDNDIWKDNNIKGYEKLVLIYLVRNFNVNYGYSFPLREQIQEATGISKDTLNKVLNSLEEKGYITRSKREGKAGRNNIYYINKYLVGQETSSQASTEPKPNNKSRNKKKQATEPQEDLDYKLGYIESSAGFTGNFTEQQASLLDNYSMEQIEKVFNSLEEGEEVGPWTFLNMLRKLKGVS
ncbi:helix-turn-helix domain-containing protein [Intestinibacter bartlettii]|uniref:helix-turn-helix domain-containing protein n=1 Tax=Intestinibacter bartlettii TaxID=261299 RepID=UPI001D0044E0|nr:helix-turn-helix domain-containing protein [Intestinibacter bartlettii]MCB5745363.1 helix-turn-helix domain-containing protein [Intestinibacter bartlettii]